MEWIVQLSDCGSLGLVKHPSQEKPVYSSLSFKAVYFYRTFYSTRHFINHYLTVFTGIVEELGIIIDHTIIGTSLCLKIEAGRIFPRSTETHENSQNGLKIGDSISVNGVCLTATLVKPPYFEVTAVQETLEKTTLGSLTIGTRVNLERAATLETRIGGHLVQGHIDGTATLRTIHDLNGSWLFMFELPHGFGRYVIPKGSIALDGVSLTVAQVDAMAETVTIAVIPHTYSNTNFRFLKTGGQVNVEFDSITKMVERFLQPVR